VAEAAELAFLGLGDEANGFEFPEVRECSWIAAVAPSHRIAFGADDLAVIEPVVSAKQQ